MFSIRRWGVAAGALLTAGVLVAACGSSSTTGSTGTTKPAAPASIGLRSTSVGSVVVDDSGKTLYKFDKDTAGAGTSACTSTGCAATWPADTVTGTPTAGTGVPGTIGVITRPDGTKQVTLDGHPLYRYSGDQAVGDTNGNGFGGVWHVVAASGASGAGPTTTSSGPYGY
jgi:predicted lipoprotein with Yx(FWY)xxD motif